MSQISLHPLFPDPSLGPGPRCSSACSSEFISRNPRATLEVAHSWPHLCFHTTQAMMKFLSKWQRGCTKLQSITFRGHLLKFSLFWFSSQVARVDNSQTPFYAFSFLTHFFFPSSALTFTFLLRKRLTPLLLRGRSTSYGTNGYVFKSHKILPILPEMFWGFLFVFFCWLLPTPVS